MQEVQFSTGYEPRFSDVLNDPIIKLLMQYDGVTDEDMVPLRQMMMSPPSEMGAFV